MKFINDTKAPKAVGTYSQGTYVAPFYFFSGQIGLDPLTGEMAPDFDAQLKLIFSNIDALLAGTGLKKENIVKSTVFLTDLNFFPKVNQAYTEYFATPYPARTTVEVSKLPKGGLVEIEIIAADK